MGAKAINSATISLGLLNVPIKVYTSARSGKISFNMISPKGNRLKQKYVDAVTNEEVDRQDCSKGYEYAKGKYAIFSKEEMDIILDMNTQKTIDISEFISKEQIPPIACQKTYYLGPGENSEKAYGLLIDTMLSQNVVALAQWSNRGRDNLVVLSPYQTDELYGLILQQIYYPSEMSPFDDIGIPSLNVQPEEKELAQMLVRKLTNDTLDMNKYTDKCSERVKNAVEQRIAGEDIQTAPDAPTNNMVDIMAQLKQSLEQGAVSAS